MFTHTKQDLTILVVAFYQIHITFALMCGWAVITATGVHFPCLKVSKGDGSSLSLLQDNK